MQPDISIIIPTHNASRIIDTVLSSVSSNAGIDKEVIVVDDASTDNTTEIVQKHPCRLIALKEQSGPSHARNRGAREARSSILMFMDSDALIEPDTLGKILLKFKENPGAACISGVFEKNPDHSSLCAKYRDLQLHYWHRTTTGDASVFILTAGAIRKEVFFEVGGFSTSFGKFADIEDYEIGHRIAKKYRMITAPDIRFHHLEHASPLPVLVAKLFRRARMWVPLFLQRKQFEKNYATRNRALAVLCVGTAACMTCLSLYWHAGIYAAAVLTGLFFMLDLGFYLFLLKQGGPFFLIVAAGLHLLLSVVLFSGAVVGGLGFLLKKLSGRA